MQNKKIKGIIEAVLFAFGDFVGLKSIASAIGCSEDKAREIIGEMMEECEDPGRGVRIVELNGSYSMCTKKETYDYLIKVASRPKKHILTEVLLETLSIVAHTQPVTRRQIEKIRGANSEHAINRLVEYGLVEETGRSNAPGRPLLFGITEEFYRRFGIKSAKELTAACPEESKDPAEDQRRRIKGCECD